MIVRRRWHVRFSNFICFVVHLLVRNTILRVFALGITNMRSKIFYTLSKIKQNEFVESSKGWFRFGCHVRKVCCNEWNKLSGRWCIKRRINRGRLLRLGSSEDQVEVDNLTQVEASNMVSKKNVDTSILSSFKQWLDHFDLSDTINLVYWTLFSLLCPCRRRFVGNCFTLTAIVIRLCHLISELTYVSCPHLLPRDNKARQIKNLSSPLPTPFIHPNPLRLHYFSNPKISHLTTDVLRLKNEMLNSRWQESCETSITKLKHSISSRKLHERSDL